MYFKIFILCYMTTLISGTDIPKQIHILFRHGERAPTSTYPNDPHKNYKWEGGLGYLTNRGRIQMYTLGQNLRQYYAHFLPKYYFPKEVNFTSSYSERCLMSAELVAAGMFPPKDFQIWNSELLWQPIPINYLPRNLDNLLATKTNCTEYDKEFIEVHNSSKVLKYNEQYQYLYMYLSKHSGEAIDNIEAVESLFNTLEIEKLNNLTLPQWLNNDLMTQMKLIASQNLAIYTETDYMKKIKGGFFLQTVLNLMKKTLIDNAPSINMYAGHDITLVHILRALDLVGTIKPEFGATIIFELYDSSIIKVFFLENWNAEPREQTLPKCASPCTIETFETGYHTVLPIDWYQECQSRT